MTDITAGVNSVTFMSQGYELAANLYTPEGFNPQSSYPTVIYSPPFNQVKEQTGAIYGRHLAEKEYVTLVFDHIGFGESDGAIRTFEHPWVKIDSIRDATSYARTLSFVDRDRLFGLGICASGGYIALAATSDKRLKAVATVSGMMSNRSSFFDAMDREGIYALLNAANESRQRAYETGEVEYVDGLGFASADPETLTGAAKEGYEFYLTPRAGAETYPTYSNLSPGFMVEEQMMADAQSYAPFLYTPYIGIYGERANVPTDTGPLTVKFFEACSQPKQLVEIEGASHVSLYDNEEDVAQAVDAMVTFFTEHTDGGQA